MGVSGQERLKWMWPILEHLMEKRWPWYGRIWMGAWGKAFQVGNYVNYDFSRPSEIPGRTKCSGIVNRYLLNCWGKAFRMFANFRSIRTFRITCRAYWTPDCWAVLQDILLQILIRSQDLHFWMFSGDADAAVPRTTLGSTDSANSTLRSTLFSGSQTCSKLSEILFKKTDCSPVGSVIAGSLGIHKNHCRFLLGM